MESIAASNELKDRGLYQMRLVATGFLLLAVLIYGLSTSFGQLHPAIGYVAAFSEAAVVGAIADWFAVVALFHHPLGLRFAAGFIAPLFDPDDGSVYNAGRRSIAIRMWGAFVAHARPSLVPLLNEIFREQQPSGRSSSRADADGDDGAAGDEFERARSWPRLTLDPAG